MAQPPAAPAPAGADAGGPPPIVVELGETLRVGLAGAVLPQVCRPAHAERRGDDATSAGPRSILPSGQAEFAFAGSTDIAAFGDVVAAAIRGLPEGYRGAGADARTNQPRYRDQGNDDDEWLGAIGKAAASRRGGGGGACEDNGIDITAPVLFVVPYYAGELLRAQLAEMAFTQFHAPETFVLPAPVPALYSVGLATGLHVDCGARALAVCPVADGVLCPKLCQLGRVAGARLTDVVAQAVGDDALRKIWTARRHAGGSSSSGMNPHAYDLSIEAQAIKEQFCYVAEAAQPTGGRGQGHAPKGEDVQLGLPDGSAITLNDATLRSPGYLFDPELQGSIPQLLRSTFSACAAERSGSVDPVQMLDDAVIVSGGVSLTRGFVPRLQACLRETFPSYRIQVPIAHYAPAERRAAPWIGASIVAQLLPQELWVTREEFEDEGRRVVQAKCPV